MRAPRRVLAAAAAVLVGMCGACAAGSSEVKEAVTTGQPDSSKSQLSGLPTSAEMAQARTDVEKLPTRRLAAQIVVPRRPNDSVEAARLVREMGYGGMAHFAEHTPADKTKVVQNITEANKRISAAVQSDRQWPAFIAVDQEGGPVTRVGDPLTRFGAVMGLGAARDTKLAQRVGASSATELAGLGFTVVLAPDADVTSGEQDPTIGVRSASSDSKLAAEIVAGLAQGYADGGVVAVAKHFPGHGSVPADTHQGRVRQRMPMSVLRDRDFLPFQELVDAGVPGVMTAHIVLDAVDGTTPSTMSRPVLSGLLRQELGFRGLVVTDALEMGAIGIDSGAAAVRSVWAGADVLLMPSDPKAAVEGLVKAVESGALDRSRLVDAAARMVATLRHAPVRATQGPTQPGSGKDVADAAAAAAITQLGGKCGAPLVKGGIVISGGTAGDRALLAESAKAAGLAVGAGTAVRLIDSVVYRAAEEKKPHLVAKVTPPTPDAVTVALDVPYALAREQGATLATFGRTPAVMRALVEVLVGHKPAAGRLPVAVGTHAVGAGCGASQ
ncbi:beta-hexosaminidase [Dermatophilus congolensis]|uniref:beta-N-acetylhexosaminidase n=2 Tax=Dermatophilus congolensis TaxID=1863 RepID=A0AA46H0S4_9MICO|nr:beta-hexosaminidase [Dermatophilus congolensis]